MDTETSRIVRLVDDLLSDIWPTTDEDLYDFLAIHGVSASGGTWNERGTMRLGEVRSLTVNLAGSWAYSPKTGVALCFFIEHPISDENATRPAYEGMFDALSRRFGEADSIDTSLGSPRATWMRGPVALSLDGYVQSLNPPIIQLTIQPDFAVSLGSRP